MSNNIDKNDNVWPLINDWKTNVALSIVPLNDIDRLAEYSLHLSRIIAYPKLDVCATMYKIDQMGEEIKRRVSELTTLRPTQLIEKLNDYFFKQKDFKGNIQDYYNPLNSYLNIVLERKTGIPITLCILYMRIASFVDLKLFPVNFPTHFLVKHTLDNEDEIIVDVFNGGRIMDDYALKSLLDNYYPKENISLTRAFVEKATAAQVIIRMLNNLKGSYYESQDLETVELINEMILAIDSHYPYAIRDKGMMLLKKNHLSEALKILSSYLEINPEAEDADDILEIIRQMR